MRRAQSRYLALAGLVIVLAGLALWQWRHDRAAAPGTLLQLDPATVTRVEVTRHGHPPRRYAKRDGRWWRLMPQAVRADDGRLDGIAALAAAPVLQWRDASDFDAAKIGLDPPALVLSLDGRRIAYGAMAAFGPQRYVRVGQRIALIPAQYSPRPPRTDTSTPTTTP